MFAWRSSKSLPIPRFLLAILRMRAGAQFERIATAIPSPVMLGYHFCYGDLAHHHLVEPENLALSVRMANVAIARSKRRVDWVHVPVPIDRSDDGYFVPLRELHSADTAARAIAGGCT